MYSLIIKDKVFYKALLFISLPVIIQHIISIGLNMVDTIMVSKLGEDAITAVGLGNRFYFIFSTICFGIFSGASIFIAQYWGVGDTKSIKKVFGIDLIIGILLSLIFSFIVFLFPKQMLGLFISDSYVIELGSQYMKIIAFSYTFTAISFAFSFNSRAIHRLKMPTIINAIALSINTFINWVLITGNLGFSAYGVKGAAVATLIARVFEFSALLFFIYRDKQHPLAGTYKEFTSWNKVMLKGILKTSFPVILSETAWSVGTSVYFVAYGFIGSYAIAVVQVSTNISDFFQAIFMGVGSACAVMIGNEIGKNNIDIAFDYSKKFIKITLALSIAFSILLFLLRGEIINFFDLSPTTNYYLDKALIVFCIYFTPKMFTYMFICGILRAGGDTKFCMFVDIVTIWFIGVPLSFFAVLILNLPVHLVMAVVFGEEILKLIVVLKRYSSRKWINNLIVDYNE